MSSCLWELQLPWHSLAEQNNRPLSSANFFTQLLGGNTGDAQLGLTLAYRELVRAVIVRAALAAFT